MKNPTQGVSGVTSNSYELFTTFCDQTMVGTLLYKTTNPHKPGAIDQKFSCIVGEKVVPLQRREDALVMKELKIQTIAFTQEKKRP